MTTTAIFDSHDEPHAPADRRTLAHAIRSLKETRDNATNWYYIARVWAIVAATVTAAIWFFQYQAANDLSFWWNVPVVIAAAFVIGASQHQLGGGTHEATHHILFKNRMLNELAGDWLCSFPLYSSTYQYRLQHLAHHQFVNDPERDPDLSQLHESGHELDFPMEHIDFVKAIAKQLWLPNLWRYILVRARYSNVGVDNNVYNTTERSHSLWPRRLMIGYAVVFAIAMGVVVPFVSPWTLTAIFGLAGLGVVAVLGAIPEDRYPKTALKPVISHKTTAMSRVGFFTILYTALSAAQAYFAVPAWNYYVALWIFPLFSTFPFFMIMRQWVQHGNGDRGRLTNTRVFLVNPAIRYSVFPFGMDYHLPHHMYANVPHFKLAELHELLLQDPAYARDGVVVEGYFSKPGNENPRPSVIEVLGPEWAMQSDEVHVDSNALVDVELADADHVAKEESKSRAAASNNGPSNNNNAA